MSIFRKETDGYGSVLWIALLLSISGVLISAWINKPCNGGRGGALAVAMSFAIFFFNRNNHARVFDTLTKNIEEQKLEQQVKSLVNAIRRQNGVASHGMSTQNWYLTISSVTGTIVWGFGDWFAQWVIDLKTHIF